MEELNIGQHNTIILEKRRLQRIGELSERKSLTTEEQLELIELQGPIQSTPRIAKEAVKEYFSPITDLFKKKK